MLPGEGHGFVTVPQLVELCGFVLAIAAAAAAGATVPETGQRGAHFHPLHCHRTLDGLPQLQR